LARLNKTAWAKESHLNKPDKYFFRGCFHSRKQRGHFEIAFLEDVRFLQS